VKAIEDTFADLPISRQRRYQLRKKAQSKCQQCGSRFINRGFAHCRKCAQKVHDARGHKVSYWDTERNRAARARKMALANKEKVEFERARQQMINAWLPPELKGGK
jgi:hypothetical protein